MLRTGLMMGVPLMHEAWRAGVEKFINIGTVCAYLTPSTSPGQTASHGASLVLSGAEGCEPGARTIGWYRMTRTIQHQEYALGYLEAVLRYVTSAAEGIRVEDVGIGVACCPSAF